MLPQPLDTLLGYKAIALSAELSATAKRVAAAILDSFNRKNGQCDPGLDRIAHLLGIDRRTVIRSIRQVEKAGFVRKLRHGGRFYRNSYEPNWVRFREIEALWSCHFKTRHWGNGVEKMSPSRCQSRTRSGDETVTQTRLPNPMNKTSPDSPPKCEPARQGPPRSACNAANVAEQNIRIERSYRVNIRSIDVALASAERRWNVALNEKFLASPKIYAELISAIDPELQSEATKHEMQRRGSGLAHILQRLRARQALDLDADIHNADGRRYSNESTTDEDASS